MPRSIKDDWKAESDARTLSEAETIKADPIRMKKAATAAAKLVKEEEPKTRALKKIARRSK